ncbi:MAG: cupin domain-containing protein [Nitrospirota bacterium]
MTVDINNIFKNIPAALPEELIDIISWKNNVKIERIVSRGHSSPDTFWYDQQHDEYVILLKGKAGLLFQDRADVVVLTPGDYINIPAHVKHCVEWTSRDEETVWLAIHY